MHRMIFPYKAKQRIEALIDALSVLHSEDTEQEVRGLALPILDAVLEAIKDEIGRENPVVQAVAAVISPETIAEGDPLRAADALVVAKLLNAEIGPWPQQVKRMR